MRALPVLPILLFTSTAAIAQEAGVFLERQKEGQVASSMMVGQLLYNDEDAVVGDVQDLIFDEAMRLRALIVGVGGFLGVAEKKVAIAWSAIEREHTEDGVVILRVALGEEALDEAPEFQFIQK